ncbi:MAG TPA: polyamine aminopropyltransferase [Elusimicrobiota bacterium]|nr:polyamine aminopropyltransferase [Elusimicrobiota bacterium]
MASPDKGVWMTEWLTPHESHSHHFKQFIVQTETRFQKAQVADTHSFGRCLVLDGEMQSAQNDEFIYHESLVHPALLMHPRPRQVLIMGGGEGATTREVLKHRSVEKCLMVDIDAEVVRFCKQHMPSWHQGSFQNPRSQVLIGDARKFVEKTENTFDVIISDLPTPNEPGPAYKLYTLEFYRKLLKRLNPDGLLVVQAGSGSLLQIKQHAVLHNTLKHSFRNVAPYYAYIPSFDVPWAFVVCGGENCRPLELSPKRIDTLIRERIKGPLSFYDGLCHAGLFGTPKHIRKLLNKEKRLITNHHPIYFYK